MHSNSQTILHGFLRFNSSCAMHSSQLRLLDRHFQGWIHFVQCIPIYWGKLTYCSEVGFIVSNAFKLIETDWQAFLRLDSPFTNAIQSIVTIFQAFSRLNSPYPMHPNSFRWIDRHFHNRIHHVQHISINWSKLKYIFKVEFQLI